MDATCTIQDSIHVFSLVHKYVSRILGTYHKLTLFVKNIIKTDEKKAGNKNENIEDVYTETKEQIVYSSFRLYISINWK